MELIKVEKKLYLEKIPIKPHGIIIEFKRIIISRLVCIQV
jgi:hypothetical protein